MKINNTERERRNNAWNKAVSNSYFENILPTSNMILIANEFINEKIDIKEAVRKMIDDLNNQ